jgi:integrase
LATVENRTRDGLAGATKDEKGLIVEYAWQLKKRGLATSTIEQRVQRLKRLTKEGGCLTDPETVTNLLALSSWTDANKQVFIVAYKSFAKTFNLEWTPPKTRIQRKLPFIPTEAEIDQLIAGCGTRTATFLQVLKDTAARGCEASKLRWTEVDEKSCTIRVNNPAKGSLARIVRVSPKTIAMILAMPRTGEYIFNPNTSTLRKGFMKQRKRIARTLQNPRLKEIHLHTLRH